MNPAEIKAIAHELGFLACGISTLQPTPHADALDAWLAKGYAGTMRYLHRQAKKRKEPQRIEPTAKSVLVLLENYYAKDRVVRRTDGETVRRSDGQTAGRPA